MTTSLPLRLLSRDHALRRVLTEPRLAVGLAFGTLAVFALVFADGFAPRDSYRYALHAFDLMGEGAARPDDHWRLRWPMTGSLAAGFALLGASERVAALVCVFWVGLLVAITLRFGRAVLGARTGTLAAVFTAGSAFCAAQAFEVRIHGFETAFGAASCWLAVEGLRSGHTGRLFGAGLLAGGAWLCRETAAPLPVVLGLASVVVARPDRGMDLARTKCLLATSAGFLAVLGAELVFYAAATGDPLHRLRLSANHEAITAGADPRQVAGTAAQALASPLQQSPVGALLTTPNVSPFLIGAVVLTGAALVLRRGKLSAAERWAGAIFGATGVLTWAFSAYALRLEEPLYAPMLPYACGLFAAWGIAVIGARFGRFALVVLAVGWVGANAAAADLRDYDEWAEARWLAARVRSAGLDGPVVTDWTTARRVSDLLTLEAIPSDAVLRPDALCAGRLVVVGAPAGRVGGGLRPAPDWRLVREVRPRRPGVVRAALRRVPGLRDLGPIASVIGPSPPLRLYEAGASAGPCPAPGGGVSAGSS